MERIGKEKVEMAVMTKAESKMASIVRTWKNIIYQHLSEKKKLILHFLCPYIISETICIRDGHAVAGICGSCGLCAFSQICGCG